MHYTTTCGPGSVAGIATGYRLNGSGNQSRWGRDFPHLSRPALGPPSLLYSGYRVFPGGKERPGRDADPSPLLVPWSWKGRAVSLLPLWAVRPVQSLGACSRVHFTWPSPLNCLAWEALPVAHTTASIALEIIWPHQPHYYATVGSCYISHH